MTATKAQTLAGTLTTLFPQLTGHAASRLAAELERIVDKSTDEGWDLTAATLLVRGARRNGIGTTLQNLRIRAGFTQEEVTRRTTEVTGGAPWHGSKLSRIESGRVPISFGDFNFLMKLYRVTDHESADALWNLARQSRTARTQPQRRAS